MGKAICKRIKQVWAVGTVLLAVGVLFACRDKLDPPVSRIVIAYMVDDNSLSDESNKKIDAMASGWNAPAGGRLFVYTDSRMAEPTLIEIVRKNGETRKQHIRTYSENGNSADPAVFANVLRDIKSKYRAQSYGLLLFSHATGWLPAGTYEEPRSTAGARAIFQDLEPEMRWMEVPEFATALPDKSFDFIVIEACLMAGVEVAYELKDKTDYILASSAEIVSPGFTDIYPQAIKCLFEDTPNLTRFAQAAFDHFNGQTGWRRSATFSVIKTAGLDALAAFVRNNADAAKQAEIDMNEVQRFGRFSAHSLFYDFEDYYSRLLATPTQRAQLSTLVNNSVVYRAATPAFSLADGFGIEKHSGLTTYVRQGIYPYLDEAYKQTKWCQEITN